MIIGKTCFLHNGREYRLSGLLFCYYSDKGDYLKFVHCEEKDANSVSGVGVAGVIAPLTEIKILDREVSHDGFFRDIEWNRQQAEKDKEELKFLMSLRPKMSLRSFKGVTTKRLYRSIDEWLKKKS